MGRYEKAKLHRLSVSAECPIANSRIWLFVRETFNRAFPVWHPLFQSGKASYLASCEGIQKLRRRKEPHKKGADPPYTPMSILGTHKKVVFLLTNLWLAPGAGDFVLWGFCVCTCRDYFPLDSRILQAMLLGWVDIHRAPPKTFFLRRGRNNGQR